VILFRRPVASSFRAEQVPSEATDPSRRSFLKMGCACCVALAAPSAYADTPSPDVERHLAAAREAVGSDLRNYLALGNSVSRRQRICRRWRRTSVRTSAPTGRRFTGGLGRLAFSVLGIHQAGPEAAQHLQSLIAREAAVLEIRQRSGNEPDLRLTIRPPARPS
jgi:hypothetical protein